MPEADYRAKQLAIAVLLRSRLLMLQLTTANYVTTKQMDIMLKQQILLAIDTSYITRLKDVEVGYAAVTSKQILQYIITQYGTITFEDLTKNMEV